MSNSTAGTAECKCRTKNYRVTNLVGKCNTCLLYTSDLNTEVTAVLLGSNVKALATELGEYGADKVIVVDNLSLIHI